MISFWISLYINKRNEKIEYLYIVRKGNAKVEYIPIHSKNLDEKYKTKNSDVIPLEKICTIKTVSVGEFFGQRSILREKDVHIKK
jgi:hypothetical protein